MTTFTFYGHTPPGIGEETTPGRLIVVEGTDGVGRSTQIAMLQEWLESEGYAVLVTGFPPLGTGRIGNRPGHAR